MLFVDGTFEVVDELYASDFLGSVGDVAVLAREFPTSVGLLGGDREAGLKEEDVFVPLDISGFDVGAASTAPASFVEKEEGDVGAEFGSDFRETFKWDGLVVERIEPEEGGGSVTGPAPKASAVRDKFFEADFVADFDFGFLFEGAHCSGDEVGPIGRNVAQKSF